MFYKPVKDIGAHGGIISPPSARDRIQIVDSYSCARVRAVVIIYNNTCRLRVLIEFTEGVVELLSNGGECSPPMHRN